VPGRAFDYQADTGVRIKFGSHYACVIVDVEDSVFTEVHRNVMWHRFAEEHEVSGYGAPVSGLRPGVLAGNVAR